MKNNSKVVVWAVAILIGALASDIAWASATEFLEAPEFSTGDLADSVAVGDFNRDGKLDVAATNRGNNTVSVLLGKGNGTFFAHVDYRTGLGPTAIAAGDLNNDGLLDLVTANANSGSGMTVSVLLGNGDGTFNGEIEYQTGADATRLALGDLNLDGNLDVVTNGGGFLVNTVSVSLGNGDGTLRPYVPYPTNTYPGAVALSDLNHDGIPDIVTTDLDRDYVPPGAVSVLLGNGDGTFQAHVDYDVATGATAVAIADFNQDGNPDIATVSNSTIAADILLGNGDGTFQGAIEYPLGFITPDGVVTGDFDRDGKLDLATSNQFGATVTLLWGQGDGTFAVGTVTYGVGATPYGLAVGDFNQDGKPDITTADLSSEGISILLSNGDRSFRARANYQTGTAPNAVAVADFNRDGRLDLATANGNGDTVSILLGSGKGTFRTKVDYATANGPLTIVAGDLNRDGKMDLITGSDDGTLTVLVGNGNGTFQNYHAYPGRGTSWALTTADFNLDGILDVAESTGGNSVNVFLGNGDGSFQAPLFINSGTSTFGVVAADFNGDGKPDLAVTNVLGSSGLVSVLPGNGDGTFQSPLSYTTAKGPLVVAAGDLNGDGKPDLAVACNNGFVTAVAAIYIGNGDGTFQPGVNYAMATNKTAIAATDFNGDGKLDLIATGSNSQYGGDPEVLLGNGDGTFQASVLYAAGANPVGMTVGDFNGDGASDFAVSNNIDNTVSVLLNTGGTLVRLKSSPNPSKEGQPVTFTIMIAGSLPGQPVPTGSVTLKDGTNVLTTIPLVHGHAKYVTSSLGVGLHAITATYSGSQSYNPNQSQSLTQNVTQ